MQKSLNIIVSYHRSIQCRLTEKLQKAGVSSHCRHRSQTAEKCKDLPADKNEPYQNEVVITHTLLVHYLNLSTPFLLVCTLLFYVLFPIFITHLCDHQKAQQETSNTNDQKQHFPITFVLKDRRVHVRDSCDQCFLIYKLWKWKIL